MNPKTLIDDIASRADEFLDGFTSRADARAGIFELLAAEQAALPEAERKKIADGVMAILEEEGFFEGARGPSPGDIGARRNEDE